MINHHISEKFFAPLFLLEKSLKFWNRYSNSLDSTNWYVVAALGLKMVKFVQGLVPSNELKTFFCSGNTLILVIRLFLWISLSVINDDLNAHSTPEYHLLPKILEHRIKQKSKSKSNKNCVFLSGFILFTCTCFIPQYINLSTYRSKTCYYCKRTTAEGSSLEWPLNQQEKTNMKVHLRVSDGLSVFFFASK